MSVEQRSSGPKPALHARRMRFEYGAQPLHRHFVDDDLVMSHLIAVMSAIFPPGEDFFVRSVRRCAGCITDPELTAQIRGFIGQEVTHGRQHRALNQRLAELGYPTHRVERRIRRRLSFLETRLSPLTALAITAALEHYTATWAETILTDQRVQALLGNSGVRALLLWHAYEEAEHKAVAFDVYRAAGGTETRRVRVMRWVSLVFLLCVVRNTLFSLATDRAACNPVRLAHGIAQLRHSPFLSPRTRDRIRAYNQRGFHPNDVDATELLARWRTELFGDRDTFSAELPTTTP